MAMPVWARTDSTILWAGICSRDMTAGELLRRMRIIPSSSLEDVFRSYCAGLLRSESFDLKSCVIDPEPAPKAEPAPKMKPPPPSLAAGKGPPRRSAPAVHTGSAHTAKRPRETGGGSTGSVQIPGHYFGKARTKESPVQPSEPPMGGAGGSAQPSEMDVDKEGTKDDKKKDRAANEAAAASKSAKPHPAEASRPEAQAARWT